MKPVKTEHFGIQRKIVSNMTSQSWMEIPHAGPVVEFDITDLMAKFNELRASGKLQYKLSINTLMLKAIAIALKESPKMNAHFEFNRHFVKGQIKYFDEVHFSVPMQLPNGEMMTINYHNFESKTLDEMSAYILDVSRRLKNTNLTEAMFEVSLDNTLTALKKGKFKTVFCRLFGAKIGKHRVKTLSGKAKKEYNSIPVTDRITKKDIEQGTITVSNLGSIDRGRYGCCSLLEIIPPQTCVIALWSANDKPVVKVNENGEKEIVIRQILPMTVLFDHRACEYSDIKGFLDKIQDICDNPEQIMNW
ncbi:MAG: 2-oxo acid dehydrogenase subunit E2 [Clostridia bacterium]|nr:2-oxo acid dehydrogenase subunit E2 [Clostridia bacterium]